MLGFRGASRYYSERYREGFALECRAMKKVREEMGLTNAWVMIPFVRTLEEGRKVIEVLAENGLKHGAVGYLNTDWGDRGHWQVLPVSYLGFAAGAAYPR